jgi:hypothetical protein
MIRLFVSMLVVCLAVVFAQETSAPGVSGTVTDPSGASIPGAAIQLRGPGGEHRAKTDQMGHYSLPKLAPGKYQLRIAAKGFGVVQKKDFVVNRSTVFDIQLAIQAEKAALNVDDEPGRLGTEPEANSGAVVIREKQLAILSDDPDELALQLQALAGPAPGPNGGQMFIDGFTGGNLPPKSSIREVRINSNPFSPEYDRPGFARIDIFTKPGSDFIRGQAFVQYNSEVLNSRNPLLTLSTRPPYRTQFYGFNISGPLKRNKASFTLDTEHRQIDENAFILATTLDSSLNQVTVNQALATPQSRTTISPRIDYAIDPKNTLVARYQDVRVGLDNSGVGDFNLASRAYNERQSEQSAQISETAMISPKTINETRFQYLRTFVRDTGIDSAPAIAVVGAFAGGGATIGNSGATTNNWELTNTSSFVKGRHTVKWGGRVRESLLADTSVTNFSGTFTFYTLDQYQRALAGLANPSQFSLNAGTPTAHVNQTDAGVFVNDDWRARPNLTLSLGVRYEAQTNLGDSTNWAPRAGIAWGLDGKGNRPAKTVMRAGAGIFYDRIPLAVTLNALRFNGATQQSYTILDPAFFPTIPSLATLQANRQSQLLRPVASDIRSSRMYQTSVGIERQFNGKSTLSVTWINSRGVHLQNGRNINTPIDGLYPYGDQSIRFLMESAGFSRLNQLVANTNTTYKKLFLFGNYSLSYGMDDNMGVPANPYNLRAEWGPSAFGDIRHRLALGSTIPLPFKLSVSPFVVANSGIPYNITTGLDPYRTGFPSARPSLVNSNCQGSGLVSAAGFGCFNLNPAPDAPVIERNSGRGPSASNLILRVSRTWAFGREGQSGPSEQGGGHGGAPAGMFNTNSGRRYNLTLSASTLNALNHANFAPPNGDLSSSYFGQYRSLGGVVVVSHGGAPSTYNRKIDLQLRFTF